MTTFYVKLPMEFEEKWAYPSGPHYSIDDAMHASDKLRKQMPTIQISIIRRENDGSEIVIVDNVPVHFSD
jgi:hypothetical protein